MVKTVLSMLGGIEESILAVLSLMSCAQGVKNYVFLD